MSPSDICVSYQSQTRQISVIDTNLSSFLSRTLSAFDLQPSPGLSLALETPSGDLAAISTDFALQLVLRADPLTGRLVLADPADLPTVDQCMRTVFKAVVDTAARREAAAVFLALSGAWDAAVCEFGESRLADVSNADAISPTSTPSSSPRTASPNRRSPSPMRRSPSPPLRVSSRYETADSPLRGLHGSLTRALEAHVSAESGRTLADAACARMSESSVDDVAAWETSCRAAAESRALACFCTHTGISCAKCHVQAIQGTRYRCRTSFKDISLCERCRRSVGDAMNECRSFTVYDHPWEATEDYAESNEDVNYYSDSLKAPPPPLALGDCGPRVMHLQYVLYKVGYLNVTNPRFRVGLFCPSTRDAICRFQMDYRVGNGDDIGVYTAVTRTVLLSLFEELEMRCGSARCAGMGEAETPRLRTAMAA